MKQMNEQELEKRLQALPRMAETGLGGLEAGPGLKYRIEVAAKTAPKRRKRQLRFVPALCCAAAALALVIFVPDWGAQEPTGLMNTQALGPNATEPVNSALLDLGDTSVSISATRSAPEYSTIWAKSENGSFPMIGLRGSYYRLLTTPKRVSQSALGSLLGTVEEFTREPSLSGTNVVMSNTASAGTEVYEISGMGGTLIAAEVDGKLRAFQRGSFNGNALLGQEGLDEVLQVRGHISSMTLSGVGIVSDASACDTLLDVLLNNASYESSGSLSAKQSLLLSLDNGLTIQLAVKNEKLAGCGVWSCPEFFERFEASCE